MNSTKHLIPLVCCLLFLLTNRVYAGNGDDIGSIVGGPAPIGDGLSPSRAGFGGFGADAICALCIRIGNYQCYLRYCSGGRGMMGGMGFVDGSNGGGRLLPLGPFRPWNPTCALCTTAACRRLWCASGRAGTGRVFYSGGNNFIGNGYGTGGGYAPSAYFPYNHGVSSEYMNRAIKSQRIKYRKY